ncbi:C40 family peptidase [Monashia sp. NPDC004114]
MLANPNDPTGAAYPNQGVGFDHDSLGHFQQRPGWGTAAQRMSPIESTQLFLDALLALPGWQDMTPWYAAQMVQRSAFTAVPTQANGRSSVVGENYQRQAQRAAGVLSSMTGDTPELACDAAEPGAVPPGIDGSHGLPTGYAVPAGTSPQAQMAVTFALAQPGKPYLWGGNGPAAYNCSGLTQQAWIRGGVPSAGSSANSFETACRPLSPPCFPAISS